MSDAHVRLLDDARQVAAAADRTVRRLLLEADEQDATFLSSLEELAETATQVVLHTTVGRRLTGKVRLLAADHVALDTEHGTSWVRISAITLVAPVRAAVAPGRGDGGPVRPALDLAGALRGLLERRARIEIVLEGGATVRGVVVAVGRDVLTLRDGPGHQTLVPLARAALVATADG